MIKQKNNKTLYIIGGIVVLLLIVGIVKFSSNPLSKDSEKEISYLTIDSVSVSTETKYHIINSCPLCEIDNNCAYITPRFDLNVIVNPTFNSDKFYCKLSHNGNIFPSSQVEFYNIPIWNGKGILNDIPVDLDGYTNNYQICCNYDYTNAKGYSVKSEEICSNYYSLSQLLLIQLKRDCTCNNKKAIC